jgi:hypothetical protein
VTLCALALASLPLPAPPSPQVIGFAAAPLGLPWPDGVCRGPWCAVYNGFGTIRVVSAPDGTRAVLLSPRAATAASRTYAALVRTRQTWRDVDFTVRVRTLTQRRAGVPNPWEVAWVLWHYADDRHFYYFVAKPNGWELGKEDPAYPGAQRYLPADKRPRYPIRRAYLVRVRHVGATMTVWVAGKRLVTFTDRERPYRSGSIALYSEDASALFSPVTVRTA